VIALASFVWVNDGWADEGAAELLAKLTQLRQADQRQREAIRRQAIDRAGLQMGPWYCVAPIGDESLYGFFSRCFSKAFPQEQEAVQAGRKQIDLDKTYENGRLRWTAHPDWVDGFFHPLPTGPPPSRNETAYLYRTITAKSDLTLKAHVVAEDAIRVWLNGVVVGQATREGGGRYKRFLEVKLPLRQGENRLLIKMTSFHGAHGFGFALPLITRTNEFRPSSAGATGVHCLPANLQSSENHLRGANRPYASASRLQKQLVLANRTSPPSHYVKKDAWQQTLLASLQAKASLNQGLWEQLARDFPDERLQQEMDRERSSGIWQWVENTSDGLLQVRDVRVLQLSDKNLITGGSFEPRGKPGDEDFIPDAGGHYTTRKPGTSTGRWVQSAGPADGVVLGTGYQAQDGRQSYHPGGSHGEGSVSQSFATIPGQRYLLYFYASGHPDANPVQRGTVSVGDLEVMYQTPAGTNVRSDMGWRQHVFLFTAAEETSTLTFGTLAGLQGTITIDNVEVRAVRGENLIDVSRFTGPLAPDATKNGQLATKPGETYVLLFDLDQEKSGRLRIHAGDLATDYKVNAGKTRLGFKLDGADSPSALSVTNPSIASELLDAYVRETIRLLDLPPHARSVFPTINDQQTLQMVQEVYHRAAELSESMATLEGFKFDVPRIPLYGPAYLPINEVLESSVPPTAGGREFLARLTRLREQVPAAAELDAGEDVVSAARAIDRYWSDTIRDLRPIAFIRRPLLAVNAVSPYNTAPKAPASICVFDPSRPNQPPKVICDASNGCIFDLNLSYDAKTLFFSSWDPEVEGGWHIYEIGLDGAGLKQITSGPDSDISPLPLPDGRVMFVSTRAANMLVCQAHRAGALYTCKRDGSDVRRVSSHTLSDHTPQIMDDGRVLFTRWDYGMEKGVFSRQALWTMNPDGTRFQLFFGNTIEDPNAFWQARPIPGRPEVVCTFGPHHSYQAGMIGLVYNGLGEEAPRGTGFRWITDELPIVADIGFPWGYQNAYPINEHLFLVSYGGDGEHRNRIYLLDDRGNRKCIYEDTELGSWHPILVEPRQPPPAISPAGESPVFVRRDPVEANSDPDSTTATFLVQDVYEGLFPHVQRGEITALEIVEQVPKTHPHTGGYAWGISPIIGRGTMYVRRLIGTVPVEADGSAYFTAPAARDISFHALNADGKTIQRMGSTLQAMPGEMVGCIGCHEHQNEAPPQQRMAAAIRSKPSVPQRPDWGTNGVIDFVRCVQPVLDKYCTKCHSGPTPDGQLDLSGDKTRYFNMAYNQLIEMGWVHYVAMDNADYERNVPKTYGSIVSRLCDYLDKPHQDVIVPPEDRRTVYAWIDANVPYYGVYHYTDGTVRGARDRWYAHKKGQWLERDFLPVFRRRCYECHAQQIDISQAWEGVTHQTVTSKVWNGIALMAHGFAHWDPYTTLYGPAQRINLTHPEFSQVLTAPLPKQAGGLGLCQPREGMPRPFADHSDPDYQAMLQALRRGRETLTANPRVDMLETGKYSSGKGAKYSAKIQSP